MSKNIAAKNCAETQTLGEQLPPPEERTSGASEEAIIAIVGLPFAPENIDITRNSSNLESASKKEFAMASLEQRVGYSISAANDLTKGSFFFASSTAKLDETNLQRFRQLHTKAHFFVESDDSIKAVYLIEGNREEWQQLKEARESTDKLDFKFSKSFKINAGCYSINRLEPAVNMYTFASDFGVDEAIKPKKFKPKMIELIPLSEKLMPSLLYHFSMLQRIGALETYDYVFATTMSFIGAMVAKVLVVSSDNSSRLAPIMWSLSIGKPGTGKTPTQNEVFNLFERFKLSQETVEAKNFFNELKRMADKAIILEMNTEIKQAVKTQSALNIDALAAMRQNVEILSSDAQSKKHIGRVLVVTDTTSAGLIDLLTGDLFSVILHSDELGSTLKLLSNPSNATLRGQLMQSESGNAEIKKARAYGYSSVESAAVAMIANVQPDVLLAEVKSLFNSNDGLINRFQIAVYNATSRSSYKPNPAFDADKQMLKFLVALKKYLVGLFEPDEKIVFNLAKEASAYYSRFVNALNKHIEESANFPIYAAHVSKYSGTILKVSLVYQLIINFESGCLKNDSDKVVGLKALKQAHRTITYLRSHAKKAFKENSDILHKEAESLLFKLLELPQDKQFTASNIAQRNWRGINRDTDKVEKLLEYLLSFGLVTRQVDYKKTLWKVRPTTKYMFKH